MFFPGYVRSGDGGWGVLDIGGGALCDDESAVCSGGWSHVDDVVGSGDGVAVVFDYDDGVSGVD